MKNITIVSILLALLIVGCGPSEAEIQAVKEKSSADSLAAVAEWERIKALALADSIAAAMDSIAGAVDSTMIWADSTDGDPGQTPDTTAQPPQVPAIPKPVATREKVTIFHADTLMLEGHSYPVFAEVGLKDSLKVAVESLLAEENVDRTLQLLKPLTRNDLRTSDLDGAVEVELKLVAPAGDFEITSHNSVPRKNVEEEAERFRWDWTVVPTRPTPRNARTTLELQVTYWRADGQPRDGTRKRMPIAVQVDERNFLISFWQYVRQTPAFTIPSIIIPLLGLGWGYLRRRKRRAGDVNGQAEK